MQNDKHSNSWISNGAILHGFFGFDFHRQLTDRQTKRRRDPHLILSKDVLTHWQWDSRPNQTSYGKVYFIEFVQNSIGLNMGMIFFWPPASWRLVEATNTSRRPKYAWRSQFIEKKCLMKVSQQPQKHP